MTQSHQKSFIAFVVVCLIWVFYNRHLAIGVHREEQKKIIKNCLQWRLKPVPLDHEANALPTELGIKSFGQEISEMSFVCFMHHFTCCTLFISRISRAWLYKGHEDLGWQLNVDLAQLVIWRLWFQSPLGAFWWFFLLFPVQRSVR